MLSDNYEVVTSYLIDSFTCFFLMPECKNDEVVKWISMKIMKFTLPSFHFTRSSWNQRNEQDYLDSYLLIRPHCLFPSCLRQGCRWSWKRKLKVFPICRKHLGNWKLKNFQLSISFLSFLENKQIEISLKSLVKL